MRRLLIFPIALVMCLAWSGYSDAMMCGNCVPMSGVYGADGHMTMEWMGQLGLGQKQMAGIKAVCLRTMKETIKKRAEMDVAEVELRELFLTEPADFKAVEAKVRQIEMLRGDIFILHMKSREEVRSMLTAEQRGKFDSLAAMPAAGLTPLMGFGRVGGRGLFRGTAGRRTGRCTMMDGGMMRMQSDEDGPASADEMEPDEMPHMDHQEMWH
jgi:Spy/CpxP family protein refolding chaperone